MTTRKLRRYVERIDKRTFRYGSWTIVKWSRCNNEVIWIATIGNAMRIEVKSEVMGCILDRIDQAGKDN